MVLRYTIRLFLVLLLSCWLGRQPVVAQNISGEVIKVSAVSLTLIKFNAPVTQYDFGVRNNYTCQLRDKDRSIIIKTIGDKPVTTNLYVTEGKRAHFFVIQFLPQVDINKDKFFYDFSDLKYVKQLAAGKNNEPEKEETAKTDDKPKKLSKAEKKEQERLAKEQEAAEEAARAEAAAAKKRTEDSIAQVRQAVLIARVSAENKKKQEAEAAQKLKDAQAEMLKAQESQRLAQAKLAEAEKQAKLQKAADEQKAVLEAAKAKKAADAEKLKLAQEETAARLKKEAADKKTADSLAAIVKQQKAEEARLAALARTEEQRKQLETQKHEAEEKRKAAEAKAEELRLARQKKQEEDLENAKQAALALQAAKAAKEKEAKEARDAAIAKQQQELKEKQEALAAANALKKQKEEEAKAAAEAKRIQDEKLAQEKAQLAKEKLLAAEAEKKEKKRIADSLAALPKVYTNTELFKKYPKFLFGGPPEGQTLSPYFGDSATMAVNSSVSKEVLARKSDLQLHSDTSHGAYFILENIRFKDLNCYLKLRIKNTAATDYLVGTISLTWDRNPDSIRYKLYPIYVSEYPVLAPKTERTIVYTVPATNVHPEDRLALRVADRLKIISLVLDVPAQLYIDQSQKSEE